MIQEIDQYSIGYHGKSFVGGGGSVFANKVFNFALF